MDSKTKPSNIYTTVVNEHERNEKESNEQLEGHEPGIEKFATQTFIYIWQEYKLGFKNVI